MLVIENEFYADHYPNWRFTLGKEVYKTKDLPSRIEAIKKVLMQDRRFEYVAAHEFPEDLLKKMHPYHDFIARTSAAITDSKTEVYPDLFPGEGARLPRKLNPLWGGLYCTDAVTPIMQKTYAVVKRSAETAMTAAEFLASGRERAVYALCRPSGHHAGPRVFGGYCYFNNAAIAAEMLSANGKVAILDIDYHHGNGTQEFFEERGGIFTSSIHGDPEEEYPYFWGYAGETGKGDSKGTNLNLPLPLKSGRESYLQALDRAIEAIGEFSPDFLVVAAGFDTHKNDPIGGFSLETKDYSAVGARLAALDLPTLICQEGGYRIRVLGNCVRNFLLAFKTREVKS